jgi:hypothetical protein
MDEAPHKQRGGEGGAGDERPVSAPVPDVDCAKGGGGGAAAAGPTLAHSHFTRPLLLRWLQRVVSVDGSARMKSDSLAASRLCLCV